MAAVTLHTSGIETTSGQGPIFTVDNQLVGMFINISAVSGTLPTLVVKLQQSPNGNDWYDVSGVATGSLAGISLTPIIPSTQQLIAENVRAVWTIGGVNPSFTFEVELETI